MVEELKEKNNDIALQAKRKIALIIAGAITFFIVIFWLYYFTGKLDGTFSDTREAFESLVSDLKKNTEAPVTGLSGAIDELKLKATAVESYLKSSDTSGSVLENVSNDLTQ